MSVEVAALGVGRSVVRLVVGRWLAGQTARDAAAKDLVDLIKTGTPDEIRRRKTERQFEAMADAVTERLLTFARQEFGGLGDSDREAVLHEVVRTLNGADLSDRALLADDVNPVKLARRLRASLPHGEAERQLGQAGARLYDIVLDECCDCLARILIHLPQFEPRAAAETLVRLSRMAGQVEEVLARLPARSLTAPDGQSEDEEFSRRYLAAVSESLDRLDLFGLRFERFARPQTTLSVAYVSLTVSEEENQHPSRPGLARVRDWRSPNHDGGGIRVERVLGNHRLMLVRGEAGGGKSTLLRWLAVTAARGGFTGELSGLNGHLPFLIKLRRHADRPLPRPEEYVDDVLPTLSGIAPRGWAHRQLLSGHAILLVDGVDEVASVQREAVRAWLGEVVSQFPAIRVVVTARPAAAAVGWLRAEGFKTAFLEQLGPADLRTLVQQWHDAVRDCVDLPCPPERLPSYEAKLLARLESAPHLRTLASTPLLAAMLCSLNLDREALPRDRMGLYAAALDMLMETRDATRNVPSARSVPLEREQRVRILQDLAWHLSISDRVELPKLMVERVIADRLATMPQVRADAAAVLEALLQRSGVIREPVPGQIDFVHRTIQEYLAAKHAADIGDMDLLVRNAHRDQWRETVVMAAGHANEPLRRELVTGILDRVRVEPRNARRLKLLAVACLETLPSVPDDLRAALRRCLDDLIPPRNVAAARSLATAGESVLKRLPPSLAGLSDAVAEATVQTAWLINGPESLDLLSRYAADPRTVVQNELSRAWEYFDPHDYADLVLAAMPPGGQVYVLNSPAQLAALGGASPLGGLEAYMTGPVDLGFLAAHAASLRSLSLYYDEPGADLTVLPALPQLEQLAVGVPGLADLGFLDQLPELLTIWSTQCEDITDYSPLLRFTALQTLALHGSRHLRGLHQLPSLAEVESLALSSSQLDNGPDALVAAAPKIRYLYLHDCGWLADLGPLAGLKLEDLRIRGCRAVGDLRPLDGQTRLSFLDVSHTRISDLAPLSGLTDLRILRLTGCVAVSDLAPLAALPNLEELRIEGIGAGSDLSPLARNRRLTVYIAAGQDVRGGERLGRRLRMG